MVLICIFLLSNDVECLFVFIGHLGIFSSVCSGITNFSVECPFFSSMIFLVYIQFLCCICTCVTNNFSHNVVETWLNFKLSCILIYQSFPLWWVFSLSFNKSSYSKIIKIFLYVLEGIILPLTFRLIFCLNLIFMYG